MNKFLFVVPFIFIFLESHPQIADWENYTMDSLHYIKDSGDQGYFESGGIQLDNIYVQDPVFPYWSGWILSNGQDTTSPGFLHEHNAIAGNGANGSENYAVTYVFGTSVIKFSETPGDKLFKGLYVTNSTYSYLSMLHGDNIAKKFGGETGKDPDYFMLTIKGYKNGTLTLDSIDVMLADYRFEDNAEDYILNDWKYIDLNMLAASDSLSIFLRSTDVGAFGMNTPSYVCVDNIEWDYFLSVQEEIAQIKPKSSLISSTFEFDSSRATRFILFNQTGTIIKTLQIREGSNQIDLSQLPIGIYYFRDVKSGYVTRLLKM